MVNCKKTLTIIIALVVIVTTTTPLKARRMPSSIYDFLGEIKADSATILLLQGDTVLSDVIGRDGNANTLLRGRVDCPSGEAKLGDGTCSPVSGKGDTTIAIYDATGKLGDVSGLKIDTNLAVVIRGDTAIIEATGAGGTPNTGDTVDISLPRIPVANQDTSILHQWPIRTTDRVDVVYAHYLAEPDSPDAQADTAMKMQVTKINSNGPDTVVFEIDNTNNSYVKNPVLTTTVASQAPGGTVAIRFENNSNPDTTTAYNARMNGVVGVIYE